MTTAATYPSTYSAGSRTHAGATLTRSRLSKQNQQISYTDRVYARLTMAGRVLAEFTRDHISNYSALLALVRSLTPDCRGLARLTVRNMTRGWSEQRPLMLYGDAPDSLRPVQMPWTL